MRGLAHTGPVWGALVAATFLAVLVVAPAARIAACILAAVGAVSFAKPVWGAAALPAALIWTPRIYLAVVGDEALFCRIDHAIVAGLAAYLLIREHPRGTSLHVPLVLFLTGLSATTLVGLLRGTAAAPESALLSIAQLAHLGLVFICAHAQGPRLGRAGLYAWALPVAALAAFGVAEWLRPCAPMPDGPYRTFEHVFFAGQANHAAGLLAVGAVVGAALLREPRWRALGAALAVAAGTALIGTRSREGAAALAAAFSGLLLIRVPRLRWLAPVAVAAVLVVPPETWNALAPPGSSLFDRIVNWKEALSTAPRHPWIGLGLGARHRQFYDNQYLMFLVEGGAITLVLFVGWLAYLARELGQAATSSPGLRGALSAGALCGLAAIAFQSLVAVCFVVTLVAGPLYWLAGYALSVEEPES
ncbi:MAG: hypothetical protein JXR94_12265 [Candidatus Hydrogenedentes bacterium]|nr:hypothetical protein [Candidatus Hydrogenedentota bacterium]